MSYNKDMKCKYIIIDDAPFIREIIKANVNPEIGFCVADLGTGEGAVETIRRTQAELVILDVVLPHQNGLDVAVTIRESYPDLPIIFMSGLEIDFVMDHIKGFNGVSVLQKPFSRVELNEAVDGLLRIAREDAA
jgi:DNA-binding response OmpR family regulator